MTEPEKIAHAHKLMVKYGSWILGVTIFGTANLIYYGSQPRTEIWATCATREAAPSIEIVP